NEWEKFAVAPLDMQDRVLGLIDEVTDAALAGKPSNITAKMNALVDGDVIRALYRASMAGAKVDLLVRGICCLRPGVAGLSDNIRVRSVVDRFLEHSRIFRFAAGDSEKVFLSSADWMPRNFQRRVEVMFPVEDEELRDRVVDEIIGIALADNVKARRLLADGTYVRVRPEGDAKPVRSQYRFMELAREKAQAG